MQTDPIAPHDDPLIGRARHCRLVRQAWIPMRDGTRLAATLFFPEAEGRYPVVLERTAYNRIRYIPRGEQWATDGYIYVAQDVRGRFDSDGEFDPFLQELNDTPDTVAWLRQQAWCNGQVGMMGPSYLALAQLIGVAGGAGPVPDALVPTFMSTEFWRRGFYTSGPLSLFLTFWWGCFDVGSRTNNSGVLAAFDVAELCRRLPLETLDISCGAGVNKLWRDFLAHPTGDAFWEAYSLRGRHDRFTMPTLQVSGWYDYYPAETIRNWKSLVAAAATPEIAANHRLLIGPWGHHHDLAPTPDGHRAVDFGPTSGYDFLRLYRQWFDRTLKGRPAVDGLGDRAVRIFVMGRNQWRDEDEWPLARTRYDSYYLHSDGHANTLNGTGRLSRVAPRHEAPDRYQYDPANPVPTRGGNHSIGHLDEGYKDLIWCGPCDQRPNEARPDVLVYTTESLPADLEVTGPVTLKLWAASSAPDTDFVGRLVDVYPDGRAINITEGVVRARYRTGDWVRPALIEPGAVLEYTLDLQVTSNVFLQGHALRLEVTSSNFPLWDRNLNTGENPNTSTALQIAQQTIWHDATHPSHLILPVIP